MLWKYEYKMMKYNQNNMASASAVFTSLKEKGFISLASE
jgi:hypothetical protein